MSATTSFPERRLGDLAEVFDGPHATPRKVDSGPWYLNIASLKNGRLDLSESSHIHADDVGKWTRRVRPRRGDTLFSYETRIGEAAFWDRDDEAVLGRRMGLLRPRPGIVDPRFLSLAYRSDQFQEVIRLGTLHGATVDRIPVGDLPNWRIAVPPVEEQERIATVFGAFDDLIEANGGLSQRLLSLLFTKYEALAQAAPVTPFGNVAHLVRDQWHPGDEGPRKYLGLEHFGTEGAGLIGAGSPADVQSVSLRFRRGDVLYGKLRPYFRKVSRPGFAGLCSSEIWVLRAQHGYPQSLVHALAHATSFSEAASAGSTGTRMPRADWKHISTLLVPDLRCSDIDTEVLASLEALWAAACDLHDESDELGRQRDELLPLLMSGKVRVRGLEAVAS